MTSSPAMPAEILARAFLPLHKRAFGMATGTAAAITIFVITAVTVLRQPQPGVDLELLAQYFAGYTVTWRGAVVGAAWAGFVGFTMGWFLAFGRNLLVAVMLVYIRTKAEIAQTRDFLDHI